MPESKNKAIVSAAFDAWSHGDRDFYDKILADDVAWTITGSSPLAGTYTGHQDFLDRAIRPIFERLSEPIRPTVEAIVSEGTRSSCYGADGQSRPTESRTTTATAGF